MNTGGSGGSDGRGELRGDAAGSDWDRYSHGPAAQAPTAWSPDSRVKSTAPARPRPAERDDLYVEYRYEAGFTPVNEEAAPRSPRMMANVAGAIAVGLAGLLIAVFALATSTGPTPTPTPPSSPIAHLSATPTPEITAPPELAHVQTVVPLPLVVKIADRNAQPDDGKTIYLIGPSGGVSVDPQSGRVLKVYGGPAFANGMRRAVVSDGLWISTWSGDGACGPTCWAQATTYRLDPGTGSVTNTMKGTYLIDADSDGVWVATAGKIERLDGANGVLLDWMPWKLSAEPRRGCAGLWAYTIDAGGATISDVASVTGEVVGSSTLPAQVTYGPIFVLGQCWMMSGTDGVSTGKTTMVVLTPDGGSGGGITYARSVLALNGGFWTYNEGTLQRFEPTSGLTFGAAFNLAERPSGNDPARLFSAVGRLWMIVDGGSLEGFDLQTGSASTQAG